MDKTDFSDTTYGKPRKGTGLLSFIGRNLACAAAPGRRLESWPVCGASSRYKALAAMSKGGSICVALARATNSPEERTVVCHRSVPRVEEFLDA